MIMNNHQSHSAAYTGPSNHTEDWRMEALT